MISSLFYLLITLVPANSFSCGYQYETGTYELFNELKDPSFVCLNGNKFIGSITFTVEFTSTPQIMIAMLSYYYDRNAQYSFSILTTTQQEWKFQIQCFSSIAQLHKYEFTWIAVNDNRIYVINDYLNSNSLVNGFQSNQYTFPILGAIYEVRVLIVSYFGGEADVVLTKNGDLFKITVQQGTSGLGVQIIAGLTDCFYHQGFGGGLWFEANFPCLVYNNNKQIPMFFQSNYAEYSPINNQLSRQLYFEDQQLQNQRQLTVIAFGWGSFAYAVWIYDITSIIFQPHIFQKCRISRKSHIEYILDQKFILTQLLIFTDFDQIINLENSLKKFSIKTQVLQIIKAKEKGKLYQNYDIEEDQSLSIALMQRLITSCTTEKFLLQVWLVCIGLNVGRNQNLKKMNCLQSISTKDMKQISSHHQVKSIFLKCELHNKNKYQQYQYMSHFAVISISSNSIKQPIQLNHQKKSNHQLNLQQHA